MTKSARRSAGPRGHPSGCHTSSPWANTIERNFLERNRIAIATAVGTTDFTGKACSPTGISWTYDSYALTTSLARAVMNKGLDSWFFITVDYTFGHSLEADTTRAVLASGGKVVGSVRHPLNTADFSSYLLQAKSSGAKVVAVGDHRQLGERPGFHHSPFRRD